MDFRGVRSLALQPVCRELPDPSSRHRRNGDVFSFPISEIGGSGSPQSCPFSLFGPGPFNALLRVVCFFSGITFRPSKAPINLLGWERLSALH